MPAQSKQQQKFMGIVRAIQKGEQPASKFSKKAQDAADDMKKKDVEKFASTKHKGLPKKVEQALREKIKSMVEDYVESCGYVVSAKDPNYKLKSPGGTGEEDRELKEVHKMKGAQGKMVVVPDNYVARYGKVQYNLMKKLGYTGGDHNIIKSMDWGYRNYHRQKPNDQFSSSIILKSSPEKPFGDKDGRIRKKDVMVVLKELMRQLKANKLKLDKKPVYRPDRNNPMIEFRVDPKSVMKEGFGSDEFLTKTEKKKFEKERLENAEVLGYTLTGTKDLKESTIQEKTFTPIDKIKDIKNLVKKGLVSYRGASGGFEISIRNKKVPGFPPAFSLLQKDEKKYKDIMKKQFKIKPVEKFFIKSNELTQLKKFGTIPFLAPNKNESINEDGHTDVPSATRKLKTSIEDALQIIGYLKKVDDAEPLPSWWTNKVTLSANYLNTARDYILNPHESVFAVRQDKIKNGERFPKEPNFDYDPEKGKSRIRKVNEMTTSQARDTLNHLGGKRFMVMTGAKPLTIDKKRKELLFKIGRNAKGINLVTIRLTSLDLYDMEFAQVRMGNKKVKAVEKRVYGDQLQKFFKKHTGMNTYL